MSCEKLQTKHRRGEVRTKKGLASLYVVIFTTLLLGIITLSFAKIIISEVGQTGNDDLSQSAYDSALAGIEDAKMALLRYHDCLSGRSTNNCTQIVDAMQEGIEDESCDVVRNTLSRAKNGDREEVLVQEVKNSSSQSLLQAYTCVRVAEELEDYRTTLNSDFRTRIIPLRSNQAVLDYVDMIMVRWYSRINYNSSVGLNWMPDGGNFIFQPSSASSYTPPVLSVQLIQAGDSFVPNMDFNVPEGDKTNRAEAFLYPVRSNGEYYIDAGRFTSSANKMQDDSGYGGASSERVYRIQCDDDGSEFLCTAWIGLPEPINGSRNDNATFVRVGLPYGAPTTDVSVSMWHQTGGDYDELLYFEGVQAQVDSTGRANDVYRRVETRVELVDIYYPYPEFTIQTDSTNTSAVISKDFYSTHNCWSSDEGDVTGCAQNNK